MLSFCTCWINIDILILETRTPLLFAYCNSLQDNYCIDLLKKEATCLHYFTAFCKVGYMTFTKCCSTISCHLNYWKEITLRKRNKQKKKKFNDFFMAKRLNLTVLCDRDFTKFFKDLRDSYALFHSTWTTKIKVSDSLSKSKTINLSQTNVILYYPGVSTVEWHNYSSFCLIINNIYYYWLWLPPLLFCLN